MVKLMHSVLERGVTRRRGFTLIELLVVLSIIALLLSIATPRYFHSIDKSKESVLKANLAATREALDKYYGDNGKYPDTLAALVEKKYLRSLPYDPVTESNTSWVLVPPEQSDSGAVFDLHSGAEGSSSNGTAYNTW